MRKSGRRTFQKEGSIQAKTQQSAQRCCGQASSCGTESLERVYRGAETGHTRALDVVTRLVSRGLLRKSMER